MNTLRKTEERSIRQKWATTHLQGYTFSIFRRCFQARSKSTNYLALLEVCVIILTTVYSVIVSRWSRTITQSSFYLSSIRILSNVSVWVRSTIIWLGAKRKDSLQLSTSKVIFWLGRYSLESWCLLSNKRKTKMALKPTWENTRSTEVTKMMLLTQETSITSATDLFNCCMLQALCMTLNISKLT